MLEAEPGCLRRYCDLTNVTEICKENLRLQQEKVDLKTAFLSAEHTRQYLEYLSKDKKFWPSVSDTETKLTAITKERKRLKDELEQECDQLRDKIKQISTAYDSLQERKKLLEEKQKEFENKQVLFESKMKLKPKVAADAVQRCRQAIEKLEREITSTNTKLQSLTGSISDLQTQLQTIRSQQGTGVQQGLSRAKNVLSFLEFVSGVRVGTVSDSSIEIHFTNSDQSQSSIDSGTEEFSLTLTLNVEVDPCGRLRLTGVKSNVEGLKIEDVVEDAITTNDLPYLISAVKDRWIHHFPLLSEIDILNKHHAVDWIEEQSKLRVLIGRCGKIMFTLNVPKDYPTSRNISLLDHYGVENLDNSQLPGENATLLQWVQLLEDKFGDCD